MHTDKGAGHKKLKKGTCDFGFGGNRNEILSVSFEERKTRTPRLSRGKHLPKKKLWDFGNSLLGSGSGTGFCLNGGNCQTQPVW